MLDLATTLQYLYPMWRRIIAREINANPEFFVAIGCLCYRNWETVSHFREAGAAVRLLRGSVEARRPYYLELAKQLIDNVDASRFVDIESCRKRQVAGSILDLLVTDG